jgi:hypothetical protein
MIRCAPVRWTAVVLSLLVTFVLRASSQDPRRLPIVFHVAPSALHHAEPEAFVARQLAHANATFAPLGIAFYDAGRRALDARHASLETRADRDALLAYAERGAVHCMIVAQLMDVDEPGRERRGVHWKAAAPSENHMVIVSTLSGNYVLAHELGHYFGNPAHTELPGNLMSYLPGQEPPFFTKEQAKRVLRSVERMLARGALH